MTDNKSLPFLGRLYVDHLQVMNYSERTVGHRETTLTQFSDWCEERGILLWTPDLGQRVKIEPQQRRGNDEAQDI